MHTSKRTLLATALDRVRFWDAMLLARRFSAWPWGGLTVLLYHRIANPAAVADLDPDLIDATPGEFARQLDLFQRHLVPVGLGAVLAAARGGPPLPPNAMLVTFDDGYRDNFENALPILASRGIPAVFFVSTDHVSQRKLFWWESISLFVRKAKGARLEVRYPARATLDIATAEARRRVTRQLVEVVKLHFALDVDHFLSELATSCGLRWTAADDRRYADASIMTWDEVMALHRAGMAIGSHTCTHRVLQSLVPVELDRELGESRRELERRLDAPVRAIAYPVGRPIAHLATVREAVRRAGYDAGFTTTPGVNRLRPGDDLLDLKRVPIDRGTPDALARASLAWPGILGFRRTAPARRATLPAEGIDDGR